MADSKKSTVRNIKCDHSYIVTESVSTGGRKNATKLRCCYCLIMVDLERLETKEWREAGSL